MVPVLLSLVPLHMGALHAYERLLVLLLAFGPVVVLVVVVFAVRRREIAAESADSDRPRPEYDGRDSP